MKHGHHLVTGGQRSGKSRYAERLACEWLGVESDAARSAVLVATAMAGDEEMALRIARHRRERNERISTLEVPFYLSTALREAAAPGRLLIVDCLTLWLTNWLMPAEGSASTQAWEKELEAMLTALEQLASPVVFVSNEVGWGIIPLSKEVRLFVDELGRLNQAVADRCAHVSLMVAGQAWTRPCVG